MESLGRDPTVRGAVTLDKFEAWEAENQKKKLIACIDVNTIYFCDFPSSV